jgi:hypothetical protein
MSVDERAKNIDALVEEAKWNMYGEEWETALNKLQNAKVSAIAIKDKDRIDNILELMHKARNRQKVEIT